jgi:hypothetical protein
MPRHLDPYLGPDVILTTFQVADLLQVSTSSVIFWIDTDQILGYRTPGGHRRVLVKNLMPFMTRHKYPVPASVRVVMEDYIAEWERSNEG